MNKMGEVFEELGCTKAYNLLCFGALALGLMNHFQNNEKRKKRRRKVRRETTQAE